MSSSGFVMLYRNLVDWEWYTDVNTCKVMLHCLLRVNYSAKRWQGILIKKGEYITSYEKLAVETGLTISKVRTALSKLESTNYISLETSTSHTKICVLELKYFVAENLSKQNDIKNSKQTSNPNSRLITDGSQSNINQIATTNNNIINRKKIFKESVLKHSNFTFKVLMSFYNYWSELNTKQTKMRFENEQFFEIEKRLKKWKANERTNSGSKSEDILQTNRRAF